MWIFIECFFLYYFVTSQNLCQNSSNHSISLRQRIDERIQYLNIAAVFIPVFIVGAVTSNVTGFHNLRNRICFDPPTRTPSLLSSALKSQSSNQILVIMAHIFPTITVTALFLSANHGITYTAHDDWGGQGGGDVVLSLSLSSPFSYLTETQPLSSPNPSHFSSFSCTFVCSLSQVHQLHNRSILLPVHLPV